MARPKLTNPTVSHNISLPKDLSDRLELELFSEVECRVPFGAYKDFFTQLLRDHFERQERAARGVK